MAEREIPTEGGELLPLDVESIFGARTKQPLIRLRWGATDAMITPEEARSLAWWLLQAVEASYTDAALWAFATDQMGDETVAVGLVQLLRDFRTKRERQEP